MNSFMTNDDTATTNKIWITKDLLKFLTKHVVSQHKQHGFNECVVQLRHLIGFGSMGVYLLSKKFAQDLVASEMKPIDPYEQVFSNHDFRG
jgi:hypothetical protein